MPKLTKLTPWGREVKKRLLDLDKTQLWLAEEVGTSGKYLNLILYGQRSGKKYLPRIQRILWPDDAA